MDLKKEIEVANKAFSDMKRTMCERERGPFDLTPMLHFKLQHINAYCGILLKGGDPIQMVIPAWRKIVEQGNPEFVMLMVEGYASKNTANYEKGALERDFKENPASEVREAITIQAVDIKTGRQWTSVIFYKYGDDGMPIFDEPEIGECVGDALNCNVAMVMSACRQATLIVKEAI